MQSFGEDEEIDLAGREDAYPNSHEERDLSGKEGGEPLPASGLQGDPARSYLAGPPLGSLRCGRWRGLMTGPSGRGGTAAISSSVAGRYRFGNR